MSALKVGLIGCGRIAQSVHLNVVDRLPGVALMALAEADDQRRTEASRRVPRARAFADYHELLEQPDVEAVLICLPNDLHAAAAAAAFAQGKHVYLEKPLATDLTEAERVLAAWQRSGQVGMIGFNYRFNPLFQAVRQQLQAGRLGELVGARSIFSTAARALPDWKQTRRNGGGVLLDLASHHIDLIHFFFEQSVCEVATSIRSQRSEDDTAVLQLRLADGLLIQSFFSLSAVEEDRFEIYGQGGKLAVDRYLSLDVEITGPTLERARWKRLAHGVRSLVHSPYALKKILSPANEPSYQAALTRFVEAIGGQQPARPDLSDGYRSLAVIEAAEESARAGKTVSLQQGVVPLVGHDAQKR
jgi:myo-inositol 2-dehydrogenase/D-chiro-inositol 1-dehydrogenase